MNLDLDLGGLLPFHELVIRLAMATVLGAAVGAELERLERAAGLRTHALVCVASALIMVVSTYGFPLPPDDPNSALDPSRIAAQVVSGIGFLGAGVIIFRENAIRGLTTAASIWSVAGVGLAAGGGLYVAATVGTGFMLLIQAGLRPIESRFFAHHARQHRVVIWVRHGVNLLGDIEAAVRGPGVRLRSMQLQPSGDPDEDVVELVLRAEHQSDALAVVRTLQSAEGVRRLTYRYRREDLITAGGRREQSDEMDDEDDEDDDEGNGR